jgi:hypothetical protein
MSKLQKQDFKNEQVLKHEDNDLSNSDEADEEENQKQLNKVFLDKIIKYIKTDDLIKKKVKEHNEEVKILKMEKTNLENSILIFLDKIDENYISINGTGKLIKNESKTKSAIKVEYIQESIIQSIKKTNINIEKQILEELIETIIKQIDVLRPIKKRIYLKRTSERTKKN